jgi:hypothetical protein
LCLLSRFGALLWWFCGAEAWQRGDLAGLLCKGLVEWLSGKPVEWGPGRPVGQGPSEAEIQQACIVGAWQSDGPVGLQSWGLAVPKGHAHARMGLGRAQGMESPAGWSSGSTGLWGGCLVGQLFF